MPSTVRKYICEFVPFRVPPFVDPSVGFVDLGDKHVYFININPNHPQLQNILETGKTEKQVLEHFGFKKLILIDELMVEAPSTN